MRGGGGKIVAGFYDVLLCELDQRSCRVRASVQLHLGKLKEPLAKPSIHECAGFWQRVRLDERGQGLDIVFTASEGHIHGEALGLRVDDENACELVAGVVRKVCVRACVLETGEGVNWRGRRGRRCTHSITHTLAHTSLHTKLVRNAAIQAGVFGHKHLHVLGIAREDHYRRFSGRFVHKAHERINRLCVSTLLRLILLFHASSRVCTLVNGWVCTRVCM